MGLIAPEEPRRWIRRDDCELWCARNRRGAGRECPRFRFFKSYWVVASTQPEETGKLQGMEKPMPGIRIGRR
jgi:hypothetical protein